MPTRLTAHVHPGKPGATKAIVTPEGVLLREVGGGGVHITVKTVKGKRAKALRSGAVREELSALHARTKAREEKEHLVEVTKKPRSKWQPGETCRAKIVQSCGFVPPSKRATQTGRSSRVTLGPVITVPTAEITLTKRRGRLVAKVKETLS